MGGFSELDLILKNQAKPSFSNQTIDRDTEKAVEEFLREKAILHSPLRTKDTIKKYLDRVGAEISGPTSAVISEANGGRYPMAAATIRFTRSLDPERVVKVSKIGVKWDSNWKPTKAEAKKIAVEKGAQDAESLEPSNGDAAAAFGGGDAGAF